MPTLKLAHVRRQGEDMILFPLNAAFGRETQEARRSTLLELEQRARQAGLNGHAAAVWDDGTRTRALGPPEWRGFLSSISMRWLLANVNRQISW